MAKAGLDLPERRSARGVVLFQSSVMSGVMAMLASQTARAWATSWRLKGEPRRTFLLEQRRFANGCCAKMVLSARLSARAALPVTKSEASQMSNTDLESEQEPQDEIEDEAPEPDEEEAGDDAETPSDDDPDASEKPKDDDDGALKVDLRDDEDTEDGDEPEEPPALDAKAQKRWDQLKAEAKRAKQLERENAELKAKTAQAPAPAPAVKKPGPRPTLKDVEHDEEALADALLKWRDETVAFEASEKKAKADQEAISAAYREKIKKLGKPDFFDKQKVVESALSVVQQEILLRKTKDTATLVYGLAKQPAKLAKLAAESDPLDFVTALRDLEKSMIVTRRKPTTLPESVVRGGSGRPPDEELERLERIADKTGNRAPIQHYKQQLREKQKKT